MTKITDHSTTIHGLLDAQASANPAGAFIRIGDRQVTFTELADESIRCAAALRARGIGPGDRVALAANNGVEWLTVFFAAMRLGAVIVTVNPAYRENELTHLVRSTRAKLVVSEQQFGGYDLVDFYSRADLPSLMTKVYLGDDDRSDESVLAFEDFLRGGGEEQDDFDVDAHGASARDAAVILFSSGTTGRSKGAVLTHESLLASAGAQAEEFAQTNADSLLGVMPLTHVGGITCTVLSALLVGARIEMVPKFHPQTVTDLLLAGRITIMVGVPTMYTMILDDPRLADADLSTMRLCVIGGSNVDPAMAQSMVSFFPSARLANLYGLSETSGACVISPKDVSFDELSQSIGESIGDFRARIVDVGGTPVEEGAEGELQIKGACTMEEYWQLPEESAAAKTSDGWLNTGDIATQDSRGRIALRGRNKEMYIHGGYNVFPAEIENVISTLSGVAMAAVIGVDDDKYGAVGKAFIVRAAGATIGETEIIDHCAAQLAGYKVPKSVAFVESLPLTPSGKIQKTKLKG